MERMDILVLLDHAAHVEKWDFKEDMGCLDHLVRRGNMEQLGKRGTLEGLGIKVSVDYLVVWACME